MPAKRIVVGLDGTWNRREPPPGVDVTNVVRVLDLLAPCDAWRRPQIAIYREGLGTRGRWDSLRHAYSAAGIDRKIREAYRAVADVYAPGDELYVFGASRGGYAARELCAWIGLCGLTRPGDARDERLSWSAFRDGDGLSLAGQTPKRATRGVKIRFLGAWDSVEALGIQALDLAERTRPKVGRHAAVAPAAVESARHALAIEEDRGVFKPAVWTNPPAAGQTIRQVWFPGSHADVCGGFGNRALADVSLLWMLAEARRGGLAFHEEAVAATTRPDPSAPATPSRTGIHRLLPRFERKPLATNPATEWLHETALARAPRPAAETIPIDRVIMTL